MKQTCDMGKHDFAAQEIKAVPSAETVMATLFWGIILIEFMYSGT